MGNKGIQLHGFMKFAHREVWDRVISWRAGGGCGRTARTPSSFEQAGTRAYGEDSLCLCEVCDFSGSGKTRWAGWVVSSHRVQLAEKIDGWCLARCVLPRKRGRGVWRCLKEVSQTCKKGRRAESSKDVKKRWRRGETRG